MSNQTTDLPVSWVVAYASIIGNGHITAGLPCQDSCVHQQLNATWGIAVVADGAGSASQSDKGSNFIARNTVHCFEEILTRKAWNTVENVPTAEEWRTEALQALQIVRQRLQQYADNQEIKVNALASTVLVVLYAPFAVLTVHIGDGRAAYSTEPNKWKALIEPFRGNEVNETVFLTSNIWTQEGVEKYIATDIKKEAIRAFALLSDGCEKGSFEVNVWQEEQQKYHDPNRPYVRFFEPNIQGLLQLYKEEKTQEEINAIWADFLTAGNKAFKHETDDKTMVLGVCVPKKQ